MLLLVSNALALSTLVQGRDSQSCFGAVTNRVALSWGPRIVPVQWETLFLGSQGCTEASSMTFIASFATILVRIRDLASLLTLGWPNLLYRRDSVTKTLLSLILAEGRRLLT